MNPEFQRNLWLEAAPRRIGFVGVCLALVYGATLLTSWDSPQGPWPVLGTVGLTIFILCAVIWGGRAAGNAVLGEVAERTWDFQRLSALTPWTMTWGKLFGATSLASLAALTGLFFYAVAGQPTALGWNLLFMLALGLAVQAMSLAATLIGVRKARAEGRPARTGGVLGGVFLGLLLISGLASTAGFQHGAGLSGAGWLLGSRTVAPWWGLQVPGEIFRALSMGVFAAFALGGAWRLMRLELQMRNSQLFWGCFLLFLAFWVAGFPQSDGVGSNFVSGGLAMALAAFAAAFAEPADRVKLRGFAALVRKGDLRAATAVAPATVLPFLLAVVLALAPLVFDRGYGVEASLRTAALLAFIFRDLGVIALFRFGPRPQRGDISALVALALLYGVGGIVGRTLHLPSGGALFSPIGGLAAVSIVSGLVQGCVAWVLAVRRIQAPEVSLSAPASPSASAPAS